MAEVTHEGETPTISDRGFAHWPTMPTSYGHAIDVRESSAASGPHLWLDITGRCHLEGAPEAHVSSPYGIAQGSAAAHLSLTQARELHHRLGVAIAYVANVWAGESSHDEAVLAPAIVPDRLPVTRDQAIRLFSEARVIDVEMADELAAWTFGGGIVLVLNHTTEPPEFTLGLDATDG